MAPGRGEDRDITTFMPRVTIAVVAAGLIFLLASLVYVAPVLLEEPPPGAIQDWTRERVRARLAGKVPWLLVPSVAAAALLAARGWLPGTGERRR